MMALFGLLFVTACVVGGYLLAHGNLMVLMQPAEFVVIAGAATGALIIGTPMPVMKKIGRYLKAAFAGKKHGVYMELLKVLYELASLTRTSGFLAMESHVENSESSDILKRIDTKRDLLEFLCDSIRLVILGITPEDLSVMLDTDIDTREDESGAPSAALARIGDSLPGLGIVAAVLGIIITMNSIGGEAAMVGKHVAAALVGTFLGVLLSYGFVQPLAALVEHISKDDLYLIKVAKTGVLALSAGINPILVCESARRAMPDDERPTFQDMEREVKATKKGQQK